MTPRTDADADDLIRALCPASPAPGYRGPRPLATVTLRETLLRLSRLAGDLPPVAELHLDPVSARPDSGAAPGARVRLAPAHHQDPFLRRLP